MEQRIDFIRAWRRRDRTVEELRTEFGISRKTAYKWIKRYVDGGEDWFADQSRARKSQDHRTPEHIVDLIVREKKLYPKWGPKKLIPLLEEKYPSLEFPVPSTASDILKARGLVKDGPKRRTRASRNARALRPATGPNVSWRADHKGHFRLGNGVECYPATITDGFSRKILACNALTSTCTQPTWRVYLSAFREFGLPDVIRSDNGPPFGASNGGICMSSMAVWLIELGVVPEFIEPGHPEQNGQHERMHRTLKAETTSPPAASIPAQQKRFDAFVREFNEVRPHEALGQKRPDSHYSRSSRSLPSKPIPPSYPIFAAIRVVDAGGYFKWNGTQYFCGSAVAGRDIAIEPIFDDLFRVSFYEYEVGAIDGVERTFIPNPDWHIWTEP